MLLWHAWREVKGFKRELRWVLSFSCFSGRCIWSTPIGCFWWRNRRRRRWWSESLQRRHSVCLHLSTASLLRPALPLCMNRNQNTFSLPCCSKPYNQNPPPLHPLSAPPTTFRSVSIHIAPAVCSTQTVCTKVSTSFRKYKLIVSFLFAFNIWSREKSLISCLKWMNNNSVITIENRRTIYNVSALENNVTFASA